MSTLKEIRHRREAVARLLPDSCLAEGRTHRTIEQAPADCSDSAATHRPEIIAAPVIVD